MTDHMKAALERLGHRVRGPNYRGWMNAKCPAHDDKEPSFGYIPIEGGGYATKCHVGCTYFDIVRALDMTPDQLGWRTDALEWNDGDEWVPPPTFGPKPKFKLPPEVDPSTTIVMPIPKGTAKPPPSILHWDGRAPDKTWWYRDALGQILLACVRWDRPDGKKRVRHITYHSHRSGNIWKLGGIPSTDRPLFVSAGTWASDAPIIIVEGEKAAEAVPDVFPGRCGVSPLGGCSAMKVQDWQPIREALAAGREVVIWPDADEPGVRSMQWLSGHLGGVRVVDVTGLPDGWDLADEPPAGFDVLVALDMAQDIDRDWDYRRLLSEVLNHSPRFEGVRSRGLDVLVSVAVAEDPRQCWMDTRDPEAWAKKYAVWRDGATTDQSHLVHTHWKPNGAGLRMECVLCGQTDEYGDDDEGEDDEEGVLV